VPRSLKPETAEPQQPEQPRTPGYNALVLIGLALLGAAAYANTFENPFIIDDIPRIVERPAAHDLSRALTTRQPVTDLTFAVNHALGGLDVVGYRVVNIAIHVLAGLTLYGLIRRTLASGRLADRFGRGAAGVACAIAAIWLVHPLQTESVTYLAHRDKALMGLFYLLTLYAVVRAATAPRGGAGWMVAAAIFCLLGMGSSAVMMTAPIVALAFDRIYLSSSMSQLVRRRGLMHAALFATWLLPIANGVVRSVLDAGNTTATVGFGVQGVPVDDYAMTQPGVLLHYFKLSLWPVSQCVDYNWRLVRSITESGAIAIVVVAALLVWTVVMMFRRPAVGFIGVWFFVVAMPTSSFIPSAEALVEHRMYLPLAAIIALIVFGAHAILRDLLPRQAFGRGALFAVLLLPVLAALFATTTQRNAVYASELLMWEDILTKRPDNPRALTAVGTAYLDRGKLPEGETLIRRAIALKPDSTEAHYQLGRRYAVQRQHDQALQQFKNASQLGLVDADLYAHMGQSATVLAEYDKSIEYLEQALELEPDHVTALMHYGNALFHAQRPEEAVESFKRVVELDPSNVEAHKQYSVMLAVVGRTEEALAACDRALALRPEDEGAKLQRELLVERMEAEAEAGPHAP